MLNGPFLSLSLTELAPCCNHDIQRPVEPTLEFGSDSKWIVVQFGEDNEKVKVTVL